MYAVGSTVTATRERGIERAPSNAAAVVPLR